MSAAAPPAQYARAKWPSPRRVVQRVFLGPVLYALTCYELYSLDASQPEPEWTLVYSVPKEALRRARARRRASLGTCSRASSRSSGGGRAELQQRLWEMLYRLPR